MCQLCQHFPGRSDQIHFLTQLFYGSTPSESKPQSVFIYGPPSTGKTAVVKKLLKDFPEAPNRILASFVDCVECFTPRLLFQHAMDGLCCHKPDARNNFTSFKRIDTVQQLVRTISENHIGRDIPAFLILDKAERLRDLPSHILSSLLRLSELTETNISVILISNIPFEKFRVKGGMMEPLLIRFPAYSKEDTIKILEFDFKPKTIQTENEKTVELTQKLYSGFLETIYSIFYHNCKDLNELRYFAALLFPLYIKPIQAGTADVNDAIKLMRLAQPYFAEATEKLYLREISSAEWSQEKDLKRNVAGRAEFELPYYTKFLLIAAYLASYNPPRFDVRFFSKSAEERAKKRGGGSRKRVDKTGGKMRQQLLGPKAFPVERMLAIFYSILDEPLEDTIDIQLQITSLTTLRLLVRTTAMDRLDGTKYKCNVTFDFIRAVAKTVRFEVDKYLYDFS
ncbi:origin recognition complex, subunit 5 [Rhizopus microsporus]|uniref:Origin recognition complex, subunit 5 n=1 Tax=Rhizopus microsporus TaxID=58291 RepID=A0A1X0RL29_RHIZD|nr:origin recognition complex, subunit 5 [Rhizopus microsporus]